MPETRESLPAGKSWDDVWRKGGKSLHPMGNPKAFIAAAAWLDAPGIYEVEDWGCGGGYFKPFLAHGQTWRGVDACGESIAVEIADLTKPRYRKVDGIFCRGVLEHCHEWGAIIDNVVRCFTCRAVITLWLPFVEKTHNSNPNGIPVYRIKREDFFSHIPDACHHMTMEVTRTKGEVNEVLILLKKDKK
jgi:hypothetical protein